MVLLEGLAGSAAAAVGSATSAGHTVWSYNRENFLKDREMRQKLQFTTMRFRTAKASLWREDLRDLAELTIKKMDWYSLVNIVGLGCTIALFCAGRLEVGTPSWLFVLYQLSLVGSLAYHLLAIWFCMFSTIAAQAAVTRLLTQFVRLPIPPWSAFEGARTYGASYESLSANLMLRLPFVDKMFQDPEMEAAIHSAATLGQERLNEKPLGAAPAGVDPWNLEWRGDHIEELLQRPTVACDHVRLFRRAAGHWQGFEGFARVCMTLGFNQILFALQYYLLGYLTIEDGELWAQWFMVVMLSSLQLIILHLDLSLTSHEWRLTLLFNLAGPFFGAVSGFGWGRYTATGRSFALLATPFANASHAAWLFYLLFIADAQVQPNGTLLPVRWRGVLYLDAFGWLTSDNPFRRRRHTGGLAARGDHRRDMPVVHEEDEEQDEDEEPLRRVEEVQLLHNLVNALKIELQVWQIDEVWEVLSEEEQSALEICMRQHQGLQELPAFCAVTATPDEDFAAEVQVFCLQVSAGEFVFDRSSLTITPATSTEEVSSIEVKLTVDSTQRILAELEQLLSGASAEGADFLWQEVATDRMGYLGPSHPAGPEVSLHTSHHGVIPSTSRGAFDMESYMPAVEHAHSSASDGTWDNRAVPTVSTRRGQTTDSGGRVPYFLFTRITAVLAVLWGLSTLYALYRLSGHPAIRAVPLAFRMEKEHGGHGREEETEGEGEASGQDDMEEGGEEHEATMANLTIHMDGKEASDLKPHKFFTAQWPGHFQPESHTALGCTGSHFVASDAFGVYSARLQRPLTGASINVPIARFRSNDDCSPPEVAGLIPQDVGIHCAEEAHCRLFVLYTAPHASQRPWLLECVIGESDLKRTTTQAWRVADAWLDPEETLDAIAIAQDCPHTGSKDALEGHVRCVTVRTSTGRLAQLRRHAVHQHELVPEWATESRCSATWKPSSRDGSLLALGAGRFAWAAKGETDAEVLNSDSGSTLARLHFPPGFPVGPLCIADNSIYSLAKLEGTDQPDLRIYATTAKSVRLCSHRCAWQRQATIVADPTLA